MSFRDRVLRVEKQVKPNAFCPQCMLVRFIVADEPDLRPPVCPRCGRGPGDYPVGMVRVFVMHRPPMHGLKELPAPPEPTGP